MALARFWRGFDFRSAFAAAVAVAVLALCIVIAAMIYIARPARAGDAAPITVNCPQVRAYVAVHGEAAALAWARRYGLTPAQIAEARRCLR